MLNEKEVSLLYETLLSARGVNDVIKLNLHVFRKNILLLVKVIEKGLQTKPGEAVEGLLRTTGEGSL